MLINSSHITDYAINNLRCFAFIGYDTLNIWLHIYKYCQNDIFACSFCSFWWNNMVHCLHTIVTVNTCMKKFCRKKHDWQIGIFEFTLESFFLLAFKRYCTSLLNWKTDIRYLTLPLMAKMENFDTYSTQPTAYTPNSTYMYYWHNKHLHELPWRSLIVKNPCLYEMAAVLTLSIIPACFLI